MPSETLTWHELVEDLHEGLIPLDFELQHQGGWVPGRDHPRIAELFDTPALRLLAHRERRWARWRTAAMLAMAVMVLWTCWLSLEVAPHKDAWVNLSTWWWTFARGQLGPLGVLSLPVMTLFDPGLLICWPFLLAAGWLLLRLGGATPLLLSAIVALAVDHCAAWPQDSLWLHPIASLCWTLLGVLVALMLTSVRRLPRELAHRTRLEMVLLLLLGLVALIFSDGHFASPVGMHWWDERGWTMLGILPGGMLGLATARWYPRRSGWRSLGLDVALVGCAALIGAGLLFWRIDRSARDTGHLQQLTRFPTGLDLRLRDPAQPSTRRYRQWPSWALQQWLEVDLMWPEADFGADQRPLVGRRQTAIVDVKPRDEHPHEANPTRTVDLIVAKGGVTLAHSIEQLVQREGYGWRVRCKVPPGELGGRMERICWDALAAIELVPPRWSELMTARIEAEIHDPVATVQNALTIAESGERYWARQIARRLPLPSNPSYWEGAEAERWQAARLRLGDAPHCWYQKEERVEIARQIVLLAPLEEAELIEEAAEQLAFLNDCETLEPLLAERLRPLELAQLCAPGRKRRCPDGA